MTVEARPVPVSHDNEFTAKKRKAAHALGALLGTFAEVVPPGKKPAGPSRVHRAVEGYKEAVTIAGEMDLPRLERPAFVQEHLTHLGILDGASPEKAARQYTILSEGVDLNREVWEKKSPATPQIVFNHS